MTKSIYIAVPTHSKSISTMSAVTLLDLKELLLKKGFSVSVVFHSSSVISDLRNVIVADFLAGDAQYLFMLDSDQGVPASTIWRMIESGFPVVGCIYPRKILRWSQVDPALPAADIDRILNQASGYVGQVEINADGSFQMQNGFARALSVGGGALLIHRAALDKMREHFPELRGQGFPNEDENLPREKNNWGFFNPLVAARDGRNAGEDVAFCDRWRKCGGEVWADVVSETVHVGTYHYRGSYIEHLKSLGGVDIK